MKDRVKVSTMAPIDIESFEGLVDLLLIDRTTGDNIMWGTENYTDKGEGFSEVDNIQPSHIYEDNSVVIPRVEKSKAVQKSRTKSKAEVFTPLWIIKKQNDLIEEEFLGLELREYLSKTWLEITCGEAPYMVSRYDPVTGEYIEVDDRVGFVDRKLQRLSAEVDSMYTWIELATIAFKSSFGYEFQGDSLFLARENMLYSFVEHFIHKFDELPIKEVVSSIADIISYNVFQMNGLTYLVPFTGEEGVSEVPVMLKDWDTNEMYSFKSISS